MCSLSTVQVWTKTEETSYVILNEHIGIILRSGVYSASNRNKYQKQKNNVSVE
jgi:hypothetical protein